MLCCLLFVECLNLHNHVSYAAIILFVDFSQESKERDGTITRYDYDSTKRIVESINENSVVAISYFENDLPETLVYDNLVTISYEYNEAKQRTAIATGDEYKVTFQYDDRNRLSSVDLEKPVQKRIARVNIHIHIQQL